MPFLIFQVFYEKGKTQMMECSDRSYMRQYVLDFLDEHQETYPLGNMYKMKVPELCKIVIDAGKHVENDWVITNIVEIPGYTQKIT